MLIAPAWSRARAAPGALAPAAWRCGPTALPLSRPLVMGIVNITPDSFSDGGRYLDTQRALDHARQLVAEGADLLDLGGESTRPGAAEVGEADELLRVLPLVIALADCGVPLSVDTSKPGVMREVLAAGARIINDVRALQAPGTLEAVAASDCGVVLMHMQGEPRSMQAAPTYGNVVTEVRDLLLARRDALRAAGVASDRIALDPGFGFGKSVAHNVRLLAHLPELVASGNPVLVGLSRKSTLGALTGRAVDDRVHASVAAALLAAERGAHIVRVHDVAATVDALKVWQAVHHETETAA